MTDVNDPQMGEWRLRENPLLEKLKKVEDNRQAQLDRIEQKIDKIANTVHMLDFYSRPDKCNALIKEAQKETKTKY